MLRSSGWPRTFYPVYTSDLKLISCFGLLLRSQVGAITPPHQKLSQECSCSGTRLSCRTGPSVVLFWPRLFLWPCRDEKNCPTAGLGARFWSLIRVHCSCTVCSMTFSFLFFFFSSPPLPRSKSLPRPSTLAWDPLPSPAWC